MKKIIGLTLALFLLFLGTAKAVEFVAQKNVAWTVAIPIVDADGDIVTSAAGLDSEYIYREASAAWTAAFADLAGEATEIGTTGIYTLAFSQAEMNHDWIYAQIKTSTSGAKTQHLYIRTTVANPSLMAATDDGGVINVTGGAVDTVTTTTTATTATNVTTVNGLAANVITAASINTNAIGADEIAADGAQEIGGATWTVAARTLTAGTNIALAKGTGVTGFNDLDAAGVATAIWNAATATYGSAGSYGLLVETDLDTTISSRGTSTLTAANVWDTNISAYSGAGYAGTYLKGIWDKLPTNYIMGSSVLTAKDDEIDAILTDTAAMDTNTELRTLLTGSDTAVSTLIASDNIGINWADITNPTTAIALTGTTWSTGQAIASVSGGVTVTTNNDKTGYTASTVSDKTGYALTQTFPTNFSSLAILAGGQVGIDWSNVANKTSTVALTNTTWSAAQAVASVSGAVGSVTNAVTTTQASADLVWSSTANNRLLTAGTNIVLAKGTGVTGFNDITAASVWTSATRTLTAGDNIALAKGTGIIGFNDITAGEVWTVATRTLTSGGYSGLTATDIDNIWDEVQTGHTTALSFGKYLDAQISLIGGSSLTNDSIADAVWNEILSGHLNTGSTGKKLSEMPTPYDISP